MTVLISFRSLRDLVCIHTVAHGSALLLTAANVAFIPVPVARPTVQMPPMLNANICLRLAYCAFRGSASDNKHPETCLAPCVFGETCSSNFVNPRLPMMSPFLVNPFEL
jgi:hypothetical protein